MWLFKKVERQETYILLIIFLSKKGGLRFLIELSTYHSQHTTPLPNVHTQPTKRKEDKDKRIESEAYKGGGKKKGKKKRHYQ